MKRMCFVLLLLLCFFLCSCGALVDLDTPKSSELSEKYGFYSSSVSSIRGGCNVTPEEADEIFLVLVNDCGVDKEISVTPYVNAPYSVKYGSKTLSMTLDENVVSTVFDGDNQIYPATAADTPPTEEASSAEETEVPAENEPISFDFSSASSGQQDISSLSVLHGELQSVINTDGVVVVKVKIEPSMTNKLTIEQNYYNVADLIKNYGFNTCEELQYWAVADMTSGEESKVISFTLDKSTVDNIFDGNIVDNQIGEKATDLWILPSLQ